MAAGTAHHKLDSDPCKRQLQQDEDRMEAILFKWILGYFLVGFLLLLGFFLTTVAISIYVHIYTANVQV